MPTYVYGKNGLVDKATGEPLRLDPLGMPCKPLILVNDTMEPVKSMADGKYYTSKAALRETYKPSGNPQGESYIEVGNESPTGLVKPKADPKGIQESIQKAVARYNNGERINPA
jgi:hypothetical protein